MPAFLDQLPRHVFFTGKGGVGKTSIACATAVALADAGRRVLLVSTDPASNVGQVFDADIGNTITPIPAAPGLDALEINPAQVAEAYRNSIIDPVREFLPAAEIAQITEQLSGSCTTEIASFNEFTELLASPQATAAYDHVVFDTAPTGHTIRLLQLPGSWTGYLDAGKGDASCLGPMSGLEKNRTTYRAAVAALADPALTRLVLVSRAQSGALREVARTAHELAQLGIRARYLVVNGVLPESDDADALHRAVVARERTALKQMPDVLRSLQRDEIPLSASTIMGPAALRSLLGTGKGLPRTSDTASHPATPIPFGRPQHPNMTVLIDELATADHGLVMTMGKGGVGKTTVAAAVALELVRRGKKVLLTTTDPAAHLTATLAGEVDGLEVGAIDPEEAVAAYRENVMRTKGAALDEVGRAALAEDLRSPCTEEIAVFQQFSRAVARARHQFVVMDTAPTGHTLLLMDATGSYHREITRHMDETQLDRTTTPLMRLQDAELTKILVVTLPEPTPVLEAQGLVADLGRADIDPWAWVVNNSVMAAGSTSALLSRRATGEREHIEAVAATASRVAVIPMQPEEPVGVDHLSELVG